MNINLANNKPLPQNTSFKKKPLRRSLIFFTSIFSRFGYIDSKDMVTFGIIFPKVISEILFADSDSEVLDPLFFPNSFRNLLLWWFFLAEKRKKLENLTTNLVIWQVWYVQALSQTVSKRIKRAQLLPTAFDG